MAYTILFYSKAKKTLSNLSPQVQKQLAPVINSLADNPRSHNAEKMEALKDCYRVRSGDYRIIYTIKNDKLIVLALAIGNRKDIYTRKAIESLKKLI